MPRVTDAYRRGRRDEIAAAALRCLERDGVARTTIADIVAESGLSTGAIYSHFSNKAELARYVASKTLAVRLDELELAARDGTVFTPPDVVRSMLQVIADKEVPAKVVLQFWAESTVDPDMRPTLEATIGRLRTTIETVLLPWASEGIVGQSTSRAEARAHTAADAIIAVGQAYIANVAMFGDRDPEQFVDDIRTTFA